MQKSIQEHVLLPTIQDDEDGDRWVEWLSSLLQEKRKIPPVPNGVTDLGESPEPGGHGGPELQRTGKWVFQGEQRPNSL